MTARIYRLFPDGVAHPCDVERPAPLPPQIAERAPYTPPPERTFTSTEEIASGAMFAVVCIILLVSFPPIASALLELLP